MSIRTKALPAYCRKVVLCQNMSLTNDCKAMHTGFRRCRHTSGTMHKVTAGALHARNSFAPLFLSRTGPPLERSWRRVRTHTNKRIRLHMVHTSMNGAYGRAAQPKADRAIVRMYIPLQGATQSGRPQEAWRLTAERQALRRRARMVATGGELSESPLCNICPHFNMYS